MATKTEVYEAMLKPMQGLYTQPSSVKLDAALEQYTAGLAQFTATELRAGWERLRERYDKRWWPTLHECVTYVREAKPNRERPRKDGVFPDLANAAMSSAAGRRAIEEGWAYAYWLHLYHHGENPGPGFRADCLEAKSKTAATINHIREHPKEYGGARMAALLVNLGKEVLNREIEWQEKYRRRPVSI